MKIKIQTKKFIRNIIIGIVALFIVAFIINIAPGFKRNKFKDVTNLIIGDTNVTEKLIYPIYKDERKALYISKEDVQGLIDKTLYYDENNNMIIATSNVAVASIKIGETTKNIDGTNIDMLYKVIIKDNIIYIPIEEMEDIYNIEVKYIGETNTMIIDNLNKSMIKAEANEDTTIRYKQRALSKKVGTLEKGETVSAFYTSSKGWRLIRTEEGKVGYVKANTLTNEYILRQDMEQNGDTKVIEANSANGSKVLVEGKNILIKDLLKLTEEGILIKNTDFPEDKSEIWANLEIQNIDLSKYEERTKFIKNITSVSRKNEIAGVNVILTADKDLERFVIELAPKLREIGIITNVITSEDINQETYNGIIKYIIKK